MNAFFKKEYFALIRFKGFKSHQKRGKGHITLHTYKIDKEETACTLDTCILL